MEYNSGDFSVAGMQSKTLLELGSGCGLGGLCLFLRGAAVCLTDLEAVTTTCTVPNAHVRIVVYSQCAPYYGVDFVFRIFI